MHSSQLIEPLAWVGGPWAVADFLETEGEQIASIVSICW